MHFCFIMATFNRVKEVERYLESLNAQDYRDFELIIVDQNADDRLLHLVKQYQQYFMITHLKQAVCSASQARNRGLQQATADIIAFPDDDSVYPLHLLTQVAHFFSNTSWDGLCTRVLDIDRDEDAFGFCVAESCQVDVNTNAWAFSPTHCQFYRAASAKQVYFDETIGPGHAWVCGEDTDYLLTVLQQGASLYYRYDLCVRHPNPYREYNLWQLLRREYTYGRAFSFMMRRWKVPQALVNLMLLEPFQLIFTYLWRGQMKRACTTPAIAAGRFIGYWQSRNILVERNA